jgi:hypothetical protein
MKGYKMQEMKEERPQGSSTEVGVSSAWMNALDLTDGPPDIDTSFISLGGDSMTAVLCMTRLRTTFGYQLDMDISDFFHEQSTIRNFAKAIDRSSSTDLSAEIEAEKE